MWSWRRFLRVPWTVKDQTIGKDQSIGNQLWVSIGRTDAATEAPIVWPPDAKSQLIGRPWCWERLRAVGKGTTEDEMVGWHRWLNGHEFEQAQGDGEEQGSLVCCMQFMGSQSRIWLSNWTTTCCIKRWATPLATFILWLTYPRELHQGPLACSACVWLPGVCKFTCPSQRFCHSLSLARKWVFALPFTQPATSQSF